jgi:nicotinate-nucleotide pyrophosphorylase (carboxylating)
MIPQLLIEKVVKAALEEDLGHGLDVTSQCLIPADQQARASIIAKQDGYLAGVIIGLSAFSYSDDFEITLQAQDGQDARAGQVIAEIEGSARSLLLAERTALNFIGHLSGIATLTARYVAAVDGTSAVICDTRKTIPGLRLFQKYAVVCGGGANHRFGLDDAVLIKDNHIAVAGGIEKALDQARSYASHMHKIEIEVDTLAQLEAVMAHGGADVVLLDNMDVKTLQDAVDMAKGKIVTEASGGVSLETVRSIAETGVDYISVGALTHSATVLDVSMDIQD